MENWAKVYQDLEKVILAMGFELVDLEFKPLGGRYFLRVFIDSEQGISHCDCSRVSGALDPVLEEGDYFKQSYILEVSSPGLDRLLKKKKDFERFKGKKIKLKTKTLINNQKTFRGLLKGLNNEDKVMVELNKGELLEISLTDLEYARLEIEI